MTLLKIDDGLIHKTLWTHFSRCTRLILIHFHIFPLDFLTFIPTHTQNINRIVALTLYAFVTWECNEITLFFCENISHEGNNSLSIITKQFKTNKHESDLTQHWLQLKKMLTHPKMKFKVWYDKYSGNIFYRFNWSWSLVLTPFDVFMISVSPVLSFILINCKGTHNMKKRTNWYFLNNFIWELLNTPSIHINK